MIVQNVTKRQAIHQFFSQFGKFYERSSVPLGEEAPELPYGTYEGVSDHFGRQAPMTVNWWERTSSWAAAEAKAEEIMRAVPNGGVQLHCDGGTLWLLPGSLFVTDMGDDSDPMLKRKMFNFTIQFLAK